MKKELIDREKDGVEHCTKSDLVRAQEILQATCGHLRSLAMSIYYCKRMLFLLQLTYHK